MEVLIKFLLEKEENTISFSLFILTIIIDKKMEFNSEFFQRTMLFLLTLIEENSFSKLT